jgi:phytoene dehydrogenase-like protein
MVQRYDSVVIGAGLGGLTAAALLARAGRKVLLVERNTSVGGAASTYKVGDLVVEAALHETSDPRHPRDPKHATLSRLGLLDAVEWVPVGSLYEVRGGPVGEPFLLPDGFVPARDAMAARFPGSRVGAARLLGEMEALASKPDASNAGDATLSEAFAAALGDDEAAKCALAANLAYFHDDPRTFAWNAFARFQGAYLGSGGRFIRYGSQRLSNALRRVIQQGGGTVLLRRRVTEVQLGADGRPAALVHVGKDGGDAQTVETATVVSNAAPAVLAELLPQPARAQLAAETARRAPSISLFQATFGLSAPPSQFGVRAYSTVLLPAWMRRLDDYARAAACVQSPEETPPPLTMVDYSQVDSGFGGPPHLVSVLGVDSLRNWAGVEGLAYVEKRARLLDAVLRELDRTFPGFAAHVVSKSMNTAQSMRSYLNAPHGSVYGFAPVPHAEPSARTPLSGLYLTGSYAAAGGFNGAIAGGAAAADAVLAEP